MSITKYKIRGIPIFKKEIYNNIFTLLVLTNLVLFIGYYFPVYEHSKRGIQNGIRYIGLEGFLSALDDNSNTKESDSSMDALQINIDGIPLLINTTMNKIPDFSPWEHDVVRYTKPAKSVNCSTGRPVLTSAKSCVIKDLSSKISKKGEYEVKRPGILYLHKSRLKYYDEGDEISCCYKTIIRMEQPKFNFTKDADNHYTFSKCKPLKSRKLFTESVGILVICIIKPTIVYMNVHHIIGCEWIYEKESIIVSNHKSESGKIDPGEKDENAYGNINIYKPERGEFNVAIVGMKAISRLNFQRYMTKSFAALNNNGAIDLKGYKGVEEDAFSNLVALLSGITEEKVNRYYINNKTFLDEVPFIWKDFSKKGYITALCEDSSNATFNYNKIGFVQQPTDYYYRPIMMVSNDFIKHEENMCFTGTNIAEVELNYFTDFAKNLWYRNWFAMFWINSLSHKYYQLSQNVDDAVASVIDKFYNTSYFDNTIMLFLSDGGMEGELKKQTKLDKSEDNLPFCFILLPKWFQDRYSTAYENLLQNQEQITTPFDLYETLQDIIRGDFKNPKEPTDEVVGISLFKKLPTNRSCKAAGIAEHFCADSIL